MIVSDGHLLNGRIRYSQPAEGFRSGIEPVLLAAAVPCRAGERVLEGGSGAGAALLCLAARVPGVVGVGVERDPALAALANANAAANGWPALRFIASDVESASLDGPFDHACANPPYHPLGGTRSASAAREQAKRGGTALLTAWIHALSRWLRHRGTLTLILPVGALPDCLAAMQSAGCAADAVLPLWPRQDQAAKLLLIQGVRGGRSPLRLLPGLTLHGLAGGFTPAAEAVLREGAPLWLGRPVAAAGLRDDAGPHTADRGGAGCQPRA